MLTQLYPNRTQVSSPYQYQTGVGVGPPTPTPVYTTSGSAVIG